MLAFKRDEVIINADATSLKKGSMFLRKNVVAIWPNYAGSSFADSLKLTTGDRLLDRRKPESYAAESVRGQSRRIEAHSHPGKICRDLSQRLAS